MLEKTLHDLRLSALNHPDFPKRAPFVTTNDAYSSIRALTNLRPENAESFFATSKHPSAAKDLVAFDMAIGDQAAAAGFGANTICTAKHTNLRQKRLPNDEGFSIIKGVLFVVRGVLKPKTTTDANTLTDDSDDKQYLPPDASDFVRDYAAKAFGADYMPYVEKKGGGGKEYLGALRWEATESGVLYCLYAFPEGYQWGGRGQGSQIVVGCERVHLSYNIEWAADADRPFEDVADGLAIAPTGSQPAADTCYANLDLEVKMIGATAANVRP